eukprot:Hpha_TRINITY_DN15222_c5_g8::TRINITY_DN15222_c5_g8_i1::g.66856::m.66856
MSIFDYEANAESVYNLIPDPEQIQAKPPIYRSKHNPKAPPSYSTFGTAGTSKPLANCDGGDIVHDSAGGKHKAKKGAASIGRTVGQEVDPKKFLRRQQGAGGTSLEGGLPEPTKFERADKSRRPIVPRQEEKPVMGLTTEKNFVVANAVEAILAAPKRPPPLQPRPTQKSTMGRQPKYLSQVKKELADAKDKAASLASQNKKDPFDNRMRLLTEGESRELVAGLKGRWEQMNKQYQSLSFSMDTSRSVARKEAQEAELQRLEKAITKLQAKKCIYVYDDTGAGFHGCGLNDGLHATV